MTVTIYQGDCREILRGLPAESCHAVITSPPFWGLRDYGLPPLVWGGNRKCEHIWGDEVVRHRSSGGPQVPQTKWQRNEGLAKAQQDTSSNLCQLCGAWRGSLGLEPTPDLYVAHLVEVFREVKRVLREDGAVWLNLGDSYSTGVGSNPLNHLNPLKKSNAMFFRNAMAIGITTHGVNVPKPDQLFENGELFSLLGIERVTIKQRNNHFCQVVNCLTSPRYAWVGVPITSMTRNSTNLEIVLDSGYDIRIIISDLKPGHVSIFGVSVFPLSMKDKNTSLAIKESAKPITEIIGDGETIGNTVFFNMPLKCLPDVHLVDTAIPLPNSTPPGTGGLCDLSVIKASKQHFTLFDEDCRVYISASFVGHNCYLLKNRCYIRYDQLYTESIEKSNELKAKQQIGIPGLVKRALMRDGWICRSSIIWAKGVSGQKETEAQIIAAIRESFTPKMAEFVESKLIPNLDLWVGGCMPSSVRDRPTTSHEYVFLLAKSKSYYYDKWAIVEPAKDWGKRDRSKFRRGTTDPLLKHHGLTDANHAATGRNRRTVWQINTRGFKGAYFAVFPPDLIRPMILAGTSEKGCCKECGAPWKRVVEKAGTGPKRRSRKHTQTNLNELAGQEYQKWRAQNPDVAVGWQPTCKCNCLDTVPATVLDPFLGSGTTALVASELGRDCVGIELNPEYIEMAADRIGTDVTIKIGEEI